MVDRLLKSRHAFAQGFASVLLLGSGVRASAPNEWSPQLPQDSRLSAADNALYRVGYCLEQATESAADEFEVASKEIEPAGSGQG